MVKRKETRKKVVEKETTGKVEESGGNVKKKLRRIPKAPTEKTRMGNPREAKRSRTSRGNNLYLRSS